MRPLSCLSVAAAMTARKAFLLLACAWTIALAAPVSSAAAASTASDGQGASRTVVLVTASWHRADHLNLAFRGVDVLTPTLDDLARRGVLFGDASTVAPSPRAAAAALMTGRPPPVTGVYDEETRLGDAAQTLAERFEAAGWFTCASLGERPLGEASGLLQGFQRSDAPSDVRRREARDVVQRALALLDEADGRDVFLWVHLGDAAWPHDPPQALLDDAYEPRDDPRDPRLKLPMPFLRALPLPYADITDRNWPWCRYKACIRALDAALAPLFETPRVLSGVTAYVGLQGMALGQSGLFYKAFGTAPEIAEVPLLVSAPDAPRGVRDPRPASVLDVGVTLLARAGLPVDGFPGRDLFAKGERDGDRFMLSEHAVSASLARGDLQLVIPLQPRKLPFLTDKRNMHQAMLFDVAADPLLEHDLLAPGDGDVVAEPRELGQRGLAMLTDLVTWLRVEPLEGWAEPGEPDPDEEALRAELGYAGRPLATLRPPWRPDGCPICRALKPR